ncbi:hypothetical protein PFMALIP_00632 [Plasmodium falciparum MaliPS096_E11]|uniref:Uncharacterized protein n=1 Tax=Plasmodium falciparum MaliPS096_E11 TaxID=1036727 RepID=A0A024WWJ7_PLAFA|nr:hypothetical protein PFMALIP_00632 [Plasmodium falciparum MaliPS096_E11]
MVTYELMNTSNFNYETWTFILTTPNTSISFFIFHQIFHYGITPKSWSFLPNHTIIMHGRGGIALWANFSSKFWSIFSTNCHEYFNQKLMLLHLSAKDSYNYNFLVIPILAFIFDENISLLFPHKITYNTSQHVITKFGLYILSYNSLITCTLNISLSKKYFFYRGKLYVKFGIFGHLLHHYENIVRTLLLLHHIVHDLLYIQNGTICVQLRLYFVCNSIFLHSQFSPSTFLAQLTCTSKHSITIILHTHF